MSETISYNKNLYQINRPDFLKISKHAKEKARNETLRQEYEMLKTKYDEQVALNLTQKEPFLADKNTEIQEDLK